MKKNKGFTTLELVVVVIVVGVLTFITLGQFELARAKSRDVERKTDLHEVSKIIRLYYVDYDELPSSDVINELWGKPWVDKGYIYKKLMPEEKYLDKEYCYKVIDEKTFSLLTALENKNDMDCKKDLVECKGEHYCFEDKMTAEVKKE